MDQGKVKLDNTKLNKLINHANNLVKLLYFLFIIGIILAGIIVIKELHIISFILSVLSVLSPIFIGFIIAWLFKPLVIKIESKGIHKIVAILIVFLLILLFVFIFFKVFIPVLYNQINDLIKIFPSILNSISNFLDKLILKFQNEGIDIGNFKENILNGINMYTDSLSKNIPSYVLGITKSFFSVIGVVLMGIVVAIYILLDYENLYDNCVKIIPSKNCKEIKNLINTIGDEVRKTINGTLLVALMVLVADTIAFSLIGLNSPLLFGVLCGLTDLIPFVGPYIGGGAAVIVAFTESTPIGVGVLISCIIVQCIENYILQPIVMSKATKINPVLIIGALLLFGKFFGILGMIIATPILAFLKVMYEYISKKKELNN